MALPQTKAEFKAYILRELGGDYNEIELSDTNLDDVVSEAIDFFTQYYYNFSKDVVYKLPKADYLRESTGSDNPLENVYQYHLDDNIFSIQNIIDNNYLGLTGGFWGSQTVPDQAIDFISNLYRPTPGHNYVNLEVMLQNFSFVKTVFLPKSQWDFNYNTSTLYVYGKNETNLQEYFYLVANMFDDIGTSTSRYYQNKEFRKYAVLLANKKVYNNLRKFGNNPLPGELSINLESYKEEADKIPDFEKDIIENYSDPTIYSVFTDSDID